MNKSKKSLVGSALLALTLVVVTQPTYKAEAFLGVGDTTFVIGDFPYTIKEYVTDTLVSVVANLAIHSITSSITNWANSGFEGKPAFSQNFNRELKNQSNDVFAQVLNDINIYEVSSKTGEQTGSINVGGFLCGPFSQEIRDAFRVRLAVAKGATFQHSACTIDSVLAEGGRTLQDFENDFTKGGWPAWLELTTVPQNNRYGAYFAINDEISRRTAEATADREKQLSYGSGFLSMKEKGECIKYASELEPGFVGPSQSDAVEEDFVGPIKVDEDGCIERGPEKIVTPGQTINTHLSKALGLSEDRIVAADEVNEMIGALAQNFILKIFQGVGGLFGASSVEPGQASLADQLLESGNKEAEAKRAEIEAARAKAEGDKQAAEERTTRLAQIQALIDAKQTEVDQCNAELGAMVIRDEVVVNPDGSVTISQNKQDVAKQKAKQEECNKFADELQALLDEQAGVVAEEEGAYCPLGFGTGFTDTKDPAGEKITLSPGDFTATKEKPNMRVNLPAKVKGKSYNRITVDLDVIVGNYSSECAAKFNGRCYHAIFWSQRGNERWCWDQMADVTLIGQANPILKLTSKIGGDQKDSANGSFSGKYTVHYEYSGGVAKVTLGKGEGGGTTASFKTVPFINFKSGAFFEFGQETNPGGPEAAPIGWRFDNIKIELSNTP